MGEFRFCKRRSIGKKTMWSHLTIAFLAILSVMFLCYFIGFHYVQDNLLEELQRQVTSIAERETRLMEEDVPYRRYIVETYQTLTNANVFFINQQGKAVRMLQYDTDSLYDVDNDGKPDSPYRSIELIDQFDRQFVSRILNGETLAILHDFAFAKGTIVFAGAPIYSGETVIGGVILTQPISVFRTLNRGLRFCLMAAALISALLAILVANWQARLLVRPVQKMTRAAKAMAQGRYDQQVNISTKDEVGQLAAALNTLSNRLAKTIGRLREERDRLELVIGSIEEGILAVDGEMHVLHYNMAFLEQMELENIEALYDPERQDAAKLLNVLRDVAQSKNPRRAQWNNLSHRALLAQVTPFSDAENQMGAVCLLSDVSEEQRMEQLRRDYVANISHELRTPLTGIRGMIEPLMDGYVDTEEERMNSYSIIHKETIRLEKLVREMLDMSRLQDGRISVEMEPMELPGILEAAKRNMESIARESGVTLKVETDGSPLSCMGNEGRIMQVLVILLDNAIGFTPEGGTVTIFAWNEEKQVVAGVRDTGCGIEPKDLPLIWERFYKADRSRMRTKGTGLGLSIARLIVELMGGTISVRSEVGAGSEFSFTLPKEINESQ